MVDIILDTCALVHANDSKSIYQDSSIKLIEQLFQNSTLVIVDEGFDLNETQNKSYIGLEYLKHLNPGSLGYNLIVYLAVNQRFSFVSNKVPNPVKNRIEQLIINKKDRMFLRVTYNSIEKTLISHDYTDYQKNKRKTIKKEFDISILEAGEL